MALSPTSMRFLLEAHDIAEEQLKTLSKAIASKSLTVKQCDHASWKFRVAAAKVEEVSGRLFYARARKAQKK